MPNSRTLELPLFRVLVIEDDADDYFLILNRLVRCGFKDSDIENVTSLKLAFHYLTERSYDAIMLDLNIDDSIGIETFRLLCTAHPNVPIIILSGATEDNIARTAVRMGAQDFLCKADIGTLDLLKIISHAVERSAMLRKAREDSEFKSRFLAQMSHEIRTPMNGVIGLTEVLKRANNLTTEQLDVVETLATCGKQLISLISDILDVTKIEAGKLELERKKFNIRELVHDSMRIFSGSAAQKNLTLYDIVEPEVPTFAFSSPGRIGQVLSNLLGNAIKYTNAGFILVTVSYASTNENSGTFTFKVEDSGSGIPDAVLEKLFNEYQQASSSLAADGIRGTGLGLAISRGIIRHLGGRIGVRSKEGKGSTFWFEVELDKEDEINPRASLENKHIMVVSSSQTRRRALSSQLERRKMKVSTSHSLTEKFHSMMSHGLTRESVDLFVLDNHDSDSIVSMTTSTSKETRNLPFILVQGAVGMGTERVGFTPHAGVLSQSKLYEKVAAFFEKKTLTQSAFETVSVEGKLGLKVLVADDNRINIKVTVKLLDMLGCSSLTAENGKDAVEMLSGNDVDVVLMDYRMPVMDGLQATRMIRSWGNAKSRVPIIALTANAFDDDREECRQAGMNEFISKPITLDDLQHALAPYASRLLVPNVEPLLRPTGT
ncbi:MAG: response regulator [Rhodocyclaceae bacterium]|nr:response regulator [Rhodocyclaceae bacterium]